MSSRPFGLSRLKDALPARGAVAKPTTQDVAHARQITLMLHDYEASGLGWFWATDREGRLTYISENVAGRLGLPRDELLGRAFTALFELDRENEDANQRTLPFLIGTHTSFVELAVSASSKDAEAEPDC